MNLYLQHSFTVCTVFIIVSQPGQINLTRKVQSSDDFDGAMAKRQRLDTVNGK